MNSLIISRLSGGMETIDSLKSYKLSETADWLAYQRGSKKIPCFISDRSTECNKTRSRQSAISDLPKRNVLYVVSDSVLYTYIPQKGNNRISDKKGYSRRLHSTKTVASSLTCFVPIKIRPQPGAACIWQKIIPRQTDCRTRG